MKRLLPLVLPALLALPASAGWTYVEGAGTQSGKPYSGIITDGNWELRVYRPDASSDDFWLGCGGTGAGARVAGSGMLDLSTLLADTTAAGTPVRAVNVAGSFLYNAGNDLSGVILPDTVTNVANVAFNGCNGSAFTSLDLRNTRIRSLGGYAFAWCQSLKEVWLPETLEYVGKCGIRTIPGPLIHFAGDVPVMEPPSSNSYGSNYAAYTSSTEYQNIFNGSDNARWAFLVNAEKYPNWTRIAKAEYFDEGNPFPTGENGWIPQAVRYTSNPDYAAPFGNAWFSRPTQSLSQGRSYLIQEGTWSGAPVARPMFGLPVVEARRNAVTNTIPITLGTSPSATVVYTFDGVSRTVVATCDTNLVFGVDGLADSTTFEWSAYASGASGWDRISGKATTLTPDVVLGEPSYEISKDGRIATVFIPVTSLLSESALLEFVLDNRVVFTTNATAVGTYSYTDADLELGRTYAFTIYGSAGPDEDMRTISFVAERYKWTYVATPGSKNGCAYTGTISDKNWTLYVYQPDPASDAFWLGCGGSGTGARVEGTGELDLSPVLDDTAEDGTPVRLTNVARWAMAGVNLSDGLTLPNTVTNLGQMAFQECSLKAMNLSNTCVRSIQAFAFAWNQSLSEIWLPKTLRFVGDYVFRCCPDKTVFHFYGHVPELEDMTNNPGTGFWTYVGHDVGAYEQFMSGAENRQFAFCVDNRMQKDWNELSVPWTTTYYSADNPFPTSENNWIPASVRYTSNPDYRVPFGTTDFGRTSDTGNPKTPDSRTYLIYEKHGDACTMLILF
jgi:hypothetical protein